MTRQNSVLWVLLVIVAVVSGTAAAQGGAINTCASGRQAFQSTTFNLIQGRSRCVTCHDGSNPNAPAWATVDLDQSYVRTKSYVDFAALPQSKLVVRAGNGHCGPSCRNEAFVTELIESLGSWWSQGERDCETYRATAAVAVPGSLSVVSFSTLTWSLGTLDPSYSGLQITAEIKGIQGAGAGNIAGYIVRNPKVQSTRTDQGCLRVKGMRLMVNEAWQWFANGFETIDVALNLPDLSSGGRILQEGSVVLEAVTFPDNLAVGLKEISLVAGSPCT